MRLTSIGEYKSETYVGLSDEEILLSRKTYGSNSLPKRKIRGFFSRFVNEFGNPVTKILLIALFFNIASIPLGGSIAEAVGIASSLLISTIVAVLSEMGSDRAFAKMSAESENIFVRVIRSSEAKSIPISDIVVGDIVILSAGDRIPADGIIVSGALALDVSALNGENTEVHKIPGSNTGESSLNDSVSLFRGALVIQGGGAMRVCSVGKDTLYGSMTYELSLDSQESPLKDRLSVLSRQISEIGLAGAIICFTCDFLPSVLTVGFQFNSVLASFMLGVSVLVVAVPEGLPLMITVVLASNMKKLSRAGVLVKKLVGIETAGSIDILFCDKTGTLTKGNMEVVSFISADGTVYKSFSEIPEALNSVCAASFILNSESTFSSKGVLGGNPTEQAVLKFSGRNSISLTDGIKVSSKTPFSSQNRKSAAVVRGKMNAELIKGAPEVIIPMCSGIIDSRGIISTGTPGRKADTVINSISSSDGRVLAFAFTEGGRTVFIGLIHIRDNPRKEARPSISRLTSAGVNVIMVTGDNPDTARAVANECNLAKNKLLITGKELSEMSDEKVGNIIENLGIVARALPGDKSRLVRIARENGHICGMTGDGVNDAPALHNADVGFAMGSGSEVAKQAGDIVILDDNIASIEHAVLFGRTILSSIRKFIVFQLSINFTATALCIVAPFLSIGTPITVTQMLWINLIMDSLGGLAFAGEPALEMYMKHPPVKRTESIITNNMVHQIVSLTLISLCCSAVFLGFWRVRAVFENTEHFLCAFFCLFVFCGIANAFNARTSRLNLFSSLRENKTFVVIMLTVSACQFLLVFFGGRVFRCVPLSVRELKIPVLLALAVIPMEFIRKLFVKLSR